MASAQGTQLIDFGSTPTNFGTATVTAQATISATSSAEAFFQGSTTGDHNENAHKQMAMISKAVCGIPTAGSGFVIEVELDGLVTGQFNIKWCWSD